MNILLTGGLGFIGSHTVSVLGNTETNIITRSNCQDFAKAAYFHTTSAHRESCGIDDSFSSINSYSLKNNPFHSKINSLQGSRSKTIKKASSLENVIRNMYCHIKFS